MGEMTLFANGGALSSHIKRGQLSDITKALMGGSDSKRISIEGGVFRMMVGGQEVAVNEDRAMPIIIVRAAEFNSRTFYSGTYVKGTKAKPTCWSADSRVPHEDVKTPQSSACATCPQNVKGSSDNGKARACRFQRRLAVLLENDVQGDIYAMSIPAASVFDNGEGRKMGLQQYARFLGGHGVDVNAVVTEMRFDTNATAPKLTFSALRELSPDEYSTVTSRKDEETAINAVTMTVGDLDGVPDESEADTSAPAKPAAPTPAPAKPAAAAPAPAPTPAPAKPAAPSGFKVTKNADAEEAVEPNVRGTDKGTPPNVSAILDTWGQDVDD